MISAKFHINSWCSCRIRSIFVCVIFEVGIKKSRQLWHVSKQKILDVEILTYTRKNSISGVLLIDKQNFMIKQVPKKINNNTIFRVLGGTYTCTVKPVKVQTNHKTGIFMNEVSLTLTAKGFIDIYVY